jgi:hypothetical protein
VEEPQDDDGKPSRDQEPPLLEPGPHRIEPMDLGQSNRG